MVQKNPILLAVLGRGIHHPNATSDEWVLTPDIEVCDEKGAHLPVQVPENDDDPHSIIGGGELNILAGVCLLNRLRPQMVVCAYGARSKYLNSIGAPSESQVMIDRFVAEAKVENRTIPQIDIFNEKDWNVDESGTNRELYNVFTLASRLNIKKVAILTVAVHLSRATIMALKHLERESKFSDITLETYASELVLLQEESERYGARVRRMFASKSYVRNFENELRGINDLLAGKYKSIASVIK